jgi:hypothetical protein
MKIDDFKAKWSQVPAAETSFQRIDDNHILDIYLGRDMDGRQEILIVSEQEPAKIDSSRALHVQKGKREDGQWATRIKLVRSSSEEVFIHLCWDLVEYSRSAKSSHSAFNILIERYLKWQKLLEPGSDMMSEEAIKGLIGELLYAEKYLSPVMNWDIIMSAWLGPDGAEKDFVFDDTWVEIKAVNHNKLTVTITSAEQLASINPGKLAVVTVEATSSSDTDGFSFSSLVERFRGLLKSSPSAFYFLESKLVTLGYTDRQEYQAKYYKHLQDRIYEVVEGFPVIRKEDLAPGIVRVRYDLLLSDLEQYLLEDSAE